MEKRWCKISKEMTEKRCIANQIEAEEIFGEKASECNSCPCDVGISIRNNHNRGWSGIPPVVSETPSIIPAEAAIQAAITIKEKPMKPKPRGTCANCKRRNMAITNARGTGLCGSCRAAITGLPPDSPERAEKLTAAARKYAGLPKMHDGVKRKMKGKPPFTPYSDPASTPFRHSGPDPESRNKNIIMLNFESEADQKLLDAIGTLARQYRRTPDQQILWMVQNEKQLHEELLKEAGNAV